MWESLDSHFFKIFLTDGNSISSSSSFFSTFRSITHKNIYHSKELGKNLFTKSFSVMITHLVHRLLKQNWESLSEWFFCFLYIHSNTRVKVCEARKRRKKEKKFSTLNESFRHSEKSKIHERQRGLCG